MSGHSKWSKIRHKKGAADAKRGAIFTKLGNAITVAAKTGGGDPDMNFSLRLAIDKAKGSNMPKENIERAIKRGTGEGGGGPLDEVLYEGFLPAGRQVCPGQSLDGQKISILIECLTDNKNRTVAEIKTILEKNGGSLAGPGAVSWAFEKKGVIVINKKLDDQLELQLIEAGAEDIDSDENEIIIYTKADELQKVQDNIKNAGIEIDSAELSYIAKDKLEISDEVGEKIEKVFDLLDENEDVVKNYTNIV
jgi:YebC/PmpR family DNA-binding regulatory protein